MCSDRTNWYICVANMGFISLGEIDWEHPGIHPQALGSDVGGGGVRGIEGILTQGLKFTFCHFRGWQSSTSAEQRR